MGFEFKGEADDVGTLFDASKYHKRSRDEGLQFGLDNGEAPVVYYETQEGYNLVELGSGSPRDDIIILGRIDNEKDINPTRNGREIFSSGSIRGNEGHDIAVVHGDRSNYIFKMPSDPTSYPSSRGDIWNHHDSLYGNYVIIENVTTGDENVLVGVETVIFDAEINITWGSRGTPLEDGRMKAALENGSAMQVSIQEAIKLAEENMGPDGVRRAQLAATKEAAFELMEKHGDLALNLEIDQAGVDSVNDAVIKALEERGVKPEVQTNQYQDVAVSPGSLSYLGINIPSPGQ